MVRADCASGRRGPEARCAGQAAVRAQIANARTDQLEVVPLLISRAFTLTLWSETPPSRGLMALNETLPLPPLISPPTPMSVLPVEHFAFAPLMRFESTALSLTIRSTSSGSPLTQIAPAVKLQSSLVPRLSSKDRRTTALRSAVGVKSSRITWPLPPLTRAVGPSSVLPNGQLTETPFVVSELRALVALTISRPGGATAQIALAVRRQPLS